MAKYEVICLDEEVRHSAPFATLSAAINWAAKGHDCAPASCHDVRVTDDAGTSLTIEWADAVQAHPAVKASNGLHTIDTIIGALEVLQSAG